VVQRHGVGSVILTRDGVRDSPAALLHPERDLLSGTGGSSILWCGGAGTALYWAYRLARRRGSSRAEPEVILPATACATLANVALVAGVTPRFADVDAAGMLTLETVQARWTPRTRAVVFIHLFGNTDELGPIAAWCARRDILLIEDAAQALGGLLPDGSPVGSVGDACVYSFNRTKILECGGGALLARTASVAQALEENARAAPKLPELDDRTANALALSYRNLHHALLSLFRLGRIAAASDVFLAVRPAYDELHLRPMPDPDALSRAWSALGRVLDERQAKAGRYMTRLAGGPWRLLNGWESSGVCWRFSLLLEAPDRLLPLSECVREEGFHVSNLYWPLHHFFRPGDACPAAEAFARRVVNLWVDASVDAQWVDACASSLSRHAMAASGGMHSEHPLQATV
jgi:dTDP-4-amino-4,6-dideoxygalactose transaminase